MIFYFFIFLLIILSLEHPFVGESDIKGINIHANNRPCHCH